MVIRTKGSEQNLVNTCIHYLNLKGCFVWRNNSGVTRASYTTKAGITKNRIWRSGIRGASDIIGVSKDGRFIAVECKIGKNTVNPNQAEFLREVASRGGIAVIVYSIDDLIGKLTGIL